eukprot:3990354-Amphidinium_carterae.1
MSPNNHLAGLLSAAVWSELLAARFVPEHAWFVMTPVVLCVVGQVDVQLIRGSQTGKPLHSDKSDGEPPNHWK